MVRFVEEVAVDRGSSGVVASGASMLSKKSIVVFQNTKYF
jgi:hypothetical protein